MKPDEFEAVFDQFTESAIRLETRQSYAVPEEAGLLAAWHEGRPLPEQSVVTSPWLAKMARGVMGDKTWARARIVEFPLSEYLHYELAGYIQSAACGEEIVIADRSSCPELAALQRDFWIFDMGTTAEFAVLLTYDDRGTLTGIDHTRDKKALRECKTSLVTACRHAEPLSAFLARYREARRRAAQ